MTRKASNITWHQSLVSRADRSEKNNHKSFVLWFTGLSASGKSTLAHAVERQLFDTQHHTYVLDGDNVRHGLCSNLGFSLADREENLRRIGETAKLMTEAGVIVLTAFISPLRVDRERVRSLFPHNEFIEVFVKTSLESCEKRDPKGIYKKARAGEIQDFTGISSPYEEPLNPEITIDTDKYSITESTDIIVNTLQARQLLADIK